MIKKYFPIWICLITIMALTENITLIVFKLVLEVIFMGALWIIINAVDYIKDTSKRTKALESIVTRFLGNNKEAVIESFMNGGYKFEGAKTIKGENK